MARACPNCNNQVEAGANFCPNCGQDMNVVVPQDQRIPTEDTGAPPPPPAPRGQGTRRGRRGRGLQIAGIGCGGLIGLFFLLAIVGALIGDRDSSTVQKEEPPPKEKKEEKTPEKKEEEEKGGAVELSGNGEQVTEPFNLSGGLATFRSSYQNQSQSSRLFHITLIDSNGNNLPGGLVANDFVPEGGTAQPSKGVLVSAGEHRLNVRVFGRYPSEGPWTVTIEQ